MNAPPLDKVIFFIDLDNTLVESPYVHIFDRIVSDISDDTEKNSKYIWSVINKEFKKRELREHISAFDWDDILSCVCKKVGKKWDGLLRDYIENHINKHGIKVFDGVKSTLQILRSKNARLYCTTNGYFLYQEPLVRATELLSLFDDFITSDFVGYTKSSKQFYKKRIKSNDKVIVIGDSYKYDVLYPKEFGFYTILDVETFLTRTIYEKYHNLTPVQRPSLMKNELASHLKNLENTIYFQTCKFTELPDGIIFNFSEIIHML